MRINKRSKLVSAVAACLAAMLIVSACSVNLSLGVKSRDATEDTAAAVTPAVSERLAERDDIRRTDFVYQMILDIYSLYREQVVISPDPEAAADDSELPPIENIKTLKDYIASACGLWPADDRLDSLDRKLKIMDEIWTPAEQAINRFMLWASYAYAVCY